MEEPLGVANTFYARSIRVLYTQKTKAQGG